MTELYKGLMIDGDININDITDEQELEINETLFDRIENNEVLNQSEMDWLSGLEPIDRIIVEVENHGWIRYEYIYEIRERLWSLTVYKNDMAGTEYDEQALLEVIAQPITISRYVPVIKETT